MKTGYLSHQLAEAHVAELHAAAERQAPLTALRRRNRPRRRALRLVLWPVRSWILRAS
jgi:hypothetical protein